MWVDEGEESPGRPRSIESPTNTRHNNWHLTAGIPNAKYSHTSSSEGDASSLASEAPWPEALLLKYEIGAIIGRGASSEVFAAQEIASGAIAAVKRVQKDRSCVSERATRRLRDEVRVLSTLKHPHIVQMREVFETPTELYIVMERAMGGELFDRIVAKGSFTEAEAATVMFQLLSALSDMHGRGMIHRDIKPENLLLTTREGWELKLSDFGLVKTLEDDAEISEGRTAQSASWLPSPEIAEGLSARLESWLLEEAPAKITPEASPETAKSTRRKKKKRRSSIKKQQYDRRRRRNSNKAKMDVFEVTERFGKARTHTLCGSPYYMAPEVCARERYGPAVDIWSAGVVLYILLTGSPPWERPPQFGAPPPIDVEEELKCVSKEGVDLLMKMLMPAPSDRGTADDALEHPWIVKNRNRSLLPDEMPDKNKELFALSPRYAPQLRAFVEKRKRGYSVCSSISSDDSTHLRRGSLDPDVRKSLDAYASKRNRLLSMEEEDVPTPCSSNCTSPGGIRDDDDDDDDDDRLQFEATSIPEYQSTLMNNMRGGAL